MYRRFCRAVMTLILMVIAAPGLWSGAFAMQENAAALPNGKQALTTLTPQGVSYHFEAASSSIYDICLFPADESPLDVRAELWQGDELVASGENTMVPVSQRLIAGETYTIRLFGSGSVRMEIARHALSRCFAMPMQMDAAGDEYSKAIAREGDVHWYSVVPDSEMPVIMMASPDSRTMRLSASLFGSDGRLIKDAVQTDNGAFLLDFAPEAGNAYYIRVSDDLNGTGPYTLISRTAASGVLPERIVFENDTAVIRGRSTARVARQVFPENAAEVFLWESSDESVARVSQTGRITGTGAGTAVITAYGPGGISASCSVSVEYVPVEGVALLSDSIRMNVEDDVSLECELTPMNASDPYFEFSVYPEGVVEIVGPGVIRAIGEGTAQITVTTRDGGHTAGVQVTVDPAVKRYRALLVGQQNYAATVAAERVGSTNSVNGVMNMLETMSYDGSLFRVATRLDASRDEVIAAIENTFAAATEQDLSLFYITCHGYYADGTTFLQMADGSVLSVNELELALRQVPGEVIVLIDCCGSGGAIAQASGPDDILTGILTVFQGNAGGPSFALSKYRVIASASLEQDSYRISYSEEAGESGMATVFARALCEALGWNIEAASRSPLRADVNYDSAVTFTELCNYTRRRVMWYLTQGGSRSAYAQTVRFWPEAGSEILFSR